jgi:hypothetical protein
VVIMPWQLATAASGMTCADEILGTHNAEAFEQQSFSGGPGADLDVLGPAGFHEGLCD